MALARTNFDHENHRFSISVLSQLSSSSSFFLPVMKSVTAAAAARIIANTLDVSVSSSVLARLAPRTACPVGSSLLAPSTACAGAGAGVGAVGVGSSGIGTGTGGTGPGMLALIVNVPGVISNV